MTPFRLPKIVGCIGLLISFHGSAQVYENEKAAEYLHHYGIAYCLSKSKRYEYEAGLAQGGYFQLGHHSIDAQKAIEHYIEQQLRNDIGVYKEALIRAYLMRCLEISYSKGYQEQVKLALELDELE